MIETLDFNKIENFCNAFQKGLESYKLSYYIREKNSVNSKENVIHSAIIWIREACEQINRSPTIRNCSTELADLEALISFVFIIVEATNQIYRVIYNTNKEYPGDKIECFSNIPELITDRNDDVYFTTLRSVFGVHPTKLQIGKESCRYFSDIPLPYSSIHELMNLPKADFYIRMWTSTKKDINTIRCPLNISELVAYVQKRYKLIDIFNSRLNDIMKRNI